MERAPKESRETTKRVTQEKTAPNPAQDDLSSRLNNSPHMVAQRKKLQSLFGGAAQLQGAEDEMLQGKFKAAQRAGEEEVLQGKFAVRQEKHELGEEEFLPGKFGVQQHMSVEEEPLQGKFEAVQRAGEEELLQGRFKTAQRVGEEELLQGKYKTAQRIGEEEPLQGKFNAMQLIGDDEPLQGKFNSAPAAQLEQRPAEKKPNNTGLPLNLKSGIENLSGMSMDNVKVHYNSSQPAQLNALAYAQGTDIHVAPGQEKHLPHEAWHVVQQAQGRVQPTMQMKDGVPVNDDKGLEHEADVMGGKAIQKRVGMQDASPVSIHQAIVQAKINFEPGTEYLDNTTHDIPVSAYNRVLNKARKYYGGVAELDFKLGSLSGAAAFFTPDSYFFMGGSIMIKPLSDEKISEKSYDYNDRLAEVAHETHHAIDHFEDLNLKTESYTQKVISEFRTFAVHSAVATQIKTANKNVGSRFIEDARSLDPTQQAFGDSSKDGFAKGNRIFNIIKSYLSLYSGNPFDDVMTENFILIHRAEIDRAIEIFKSLSGGTEGEHDTYIDQETYTTESPEEDLGGGISISEIIEHTRSVRKPV